MLQNPADAALVQLYRCITLTGSAERVRNLYQRAGAMDKQHRNSKWSCSSNMLLELSIMFLLPVAIQQYPKRPASSALNTYLNSHTWSPNSKVCCTNPCNIHTFAQYPWNDHLSNIQPQSNDWFRAPTDLVQNSACRGAHIVAMSLVVIVSNGLAISQWWGRGLLLVQTPNAAATGGVGGRGHWSV